MIVDTHKIFFIIFATIFIYYLNIKLFKFNNKIFDEHQSYSTFVLGNPVGGYTIFLFILFFKFYFDYLELFFLFCIFVSGILSDNKIFNSPLKRLFFQVLIIITSISFSEIGIISTRIDFIDHLLTNKLINIIFTTFCILIVINGSNFIDGLNGLVLGYYSIIVFVILHTNLDELLNFKTILMINFLTILIILLMANFINKIFLGDNGSYLIGFLFSIYLIRIHQTNLELSPYFIILLLWYPCFENLFSIIRKKISKTLATEPDNNHFHQLFFLFISRKLNLKNKLIANNLSSIIINFYNLIIFYVGIQKLNSSTLQIQLITINIFIYIFLYIYLKKFKNKYSNKIFN